MPEKKTTTAKAVESKSAAKTATKSTTAKAAETKPAAKTATKSTTAKVAEPKPAAKTTPKSTAKTGEKVATTSKAIDPKQARSLDTEIVEEKLVKKASSSKEVLKEDKKDKSAKSNQNNKNNSNNKVKLISILSLIGFVLLIALVVVIVLSVKSCSSDNEYINEFKTSTKVGFDAEILGTYERTIPQEEKNEGRSSVGYPTYGKSLNEALGTSPESKAIRSSIIQESSYLTSVDTWNGGGGGYNRFDQNGYLYKNNDPVLDANGNQRKLYKHTAATGMYLGDVSDDEPGVIKRITIEPRGYTRGYSVTGLYVPAGEIVKIEISKADMEATNGIDIHIGQALYNGKANNIWTDKNVMNRFPIITNTLKINKDLAVYDENTETYTAYVGSFVGGPLYIRNESVSFTVTVSGACAYTHFILGYTTKEEYEESKKSSVPYFDLEVWEYGVLHSGPRKYAENFTYEQLYDVAILWDKIALVSTEISKQGIVFLYDPFVAAGAAVAFPGQGSVNCPLGWMSASLNYDGFIQNGTWGNMHEFNHNFQGWGVGNGGEVTNNALTLVSYSLFTKISSKRHIGSSNEGLSDWNLYTNASWALRQITENRFDNGKQGLAIYATLLHNFGQEVFMEAARKSNGQSVNNYFKSTMNASHNDMTYYFKDLLGYEVPSATLDEAKDKNYPMFVPVSSIYQTGRSYLYDGEKQYTQTMRPYVIPYGEEYVLDLNQVKFEGNSYLGGSIVLPDGFSYKIKNVSNPSSGSIENLGNNQYKYIPGKETASGKIYVTLEVTKDDQAFKVDDIDLVFEFELSHEMNKNTLTRTTYSYTPDKMYNTAQEAFEAGYKDYSDKKVGDNQNPIVNGKVVQNCNAEAWFTEKPATDEVIEIKGKIQISEVGKYRLALRGRYSCALYASLDGKEYELAATYNDNTSGSADFPNKVGTYKDYELAADSWIYFKAVLLRKLSDPAKLGFIGVGFGKFAPAAPIVDDDGNPILDANGNPMTKPESVKVTYAQSLREDYEVTKEEFQTDYFYKRNYKYDYKNNLYYNDPAKVIDSENYSPWDKNQHKIENVVDGNRNTYLHTNYDAASKDLRLMVDLGKELTVNRMTIYTQARADYHCPVSFNLRASVDGATWFDIGTFENLEVKNYSVTADFNETTFRYYDITFTKSSRKYIIISEIELANVFEQLNGHQISLDNEDVHLYGKWTSNKMLSTFGHNYVGNKKDTIEYTFTGTRFGVLTPNIDSDFEVYIDGQKVDSIYLREDNKKITLRYLSTELSEGTHQVKIVLTGKSTIDSIVYW